MAITTLSFPTRFTKIVLDGHIYEPDADGNTTTSIAAHVPALVRFGAEDLSKRITRAAQAPAQPTVKAPKVETPVKAAPVASAPQNDVPAASVDEPLLDLVTIQINGSETPSMDMTKAQMIEWLREHGVAIPSTVTKAACWAAIEEITLAK